MTLRLTGERTLPGIARENYWFRRHEAAYRFAAGRCGGLDVLDAGCGEGYGTALLGRAARHAHGVDLAGEVVAHARATYPRATFAQAELGALPHPSGAFGAVVSLQVIEHLWDIPAYCTEVARVLRPGGLFVCGTPNRLTFTPGSDTPVNPFHTVEFTAAELSGLLERWFDEVEVLGVFHGPRLEAAERVRGCRLPEAQIARDPERWPSWLTALVGSVTAEDFAVLGPGQRDVDACLDLVAVARAPAPGPVSADPARPRPPAGAGSRGGGAA